MTNKVIDQLWGYNEKLLELANDINGVKNSIAALQAIIEKKNGESREKSCGKVKKRNKEILTVQKFICRKQGSEREIAKLGRLTRLYLRFNRIKE